MNKSLESLISLTQISEQDRLVLAGSADQTQAWADEFVALFYDTLFGFEPTKVLFGAGERSAREKTIRHWYLQVIRGEFGEAFWESQLQAGQRHVERSILNAYMQGMMHQTQAFFLAKCLAAFDQARAVEVYTAFKKVTDVSAAIIGEGYHTPYAVMKVGN